MSTVHKLPVEYDEAQNDDRAPVVTLLGADIPPEYLDDAEPSPFMERMSGIWQGLIRLLKLSIVLALVGGYPIAMVMSHKVDSSPVVLSQAAPWYSHDTGTAMTLLGREITGAGWAADRSFWHPQARLTALPAWQDGITGALSEYAFLAARHAQMEEGVPDSDLLAAARLLAPTSEVPATPRLNAAAEALQSYEGRLSRGVAAQPKGKAVFIDELKLYQSWTAETRANLKASADRAEAWPAARADIESIYLARAYAHVASQMMNSSLIAEPELVTSRAEAEARDRALFAWRRAATFNPVFVTSQAGTGRLMSDHPATMMYYLAEIEIAMGDFIAVLEQQSAEQTVVADAGE